MFKVLTKLAFSSRRYRRAILAIGAAALLGSCGGGGGSGPTGNGGQNPAPAPAPAPAATAECALRARQNWALAQLQEWYLFPSLLNSAANPASYSSLLDYIDALVAPARAQNRDRYFTYVTSIAEENAYYDQGATAGFGLRLSYDATARRVLVAEAFEGGTALANGIDRGTEILAIGGPGGEQTVAQLWATGGQQAIVYALGPDTPGTTRVLRFRDASGIERSANLAKTTFALDPVSNRYGARILTDGARRVGYLNLRTFIDTAAPDLRAAFADFKAQGVTELIVDLRYNGGGLIGVAELLGDLMGLGRDGQVLSYTTFRDSKAAANAIRRFAVQPESIAPTRIAFIGTGATASASELVINSMSPYIGANLALIGGNTYGKPVGQIALDRPACDDRLRAVALKVENADRQGEYYNGLATTLQNTCRAADDFARPLGDPDEAMIRTALDFLAGRSCTSITATTTQRIATVPPQLLVPEAPSGTVQRELPGAY